jgi:hypothetical protein
MVVKESQKSNGKALFLVYFGKSCKKLFCIVWCLEGVDRIWNGSITCTSLYLYVTLLGACVKAPENTHSVYF